MADQQTERRERWRTYFADQFGGDQVAVAAATDAAMVAVRRGALQQEIVASGMAAARRATGGLVETSRRQPSSPARTSAPTPSFPPASGHGQVVQLEKRTESMDSQFFQVWSLRILPVDGSGGHGQVVPVEMRGRSIIGPLTQGDIVVIPKGQQGRVRQVTRLHNVTLNATIEARGRPFRRTRTVRRTFRLFGSVLGWILFLLILAVGAVIAATWLNAAGIIDLSNLPW